MLTFFFFFFTAFQSESITFQEKTHIIIWTNLIVQLKNFSKALI